MRSTGNLSSNNYKAEKLGCPPEQRATTMLVDLCIKAIPGESCFIAFFTSTCLDLPSEFNVCLHL